jgi:hypothetical protein
MVSVWAQENHTGPGQVNQKEIATQITEKETHYILSLQRNRGNLLEQVEDSFRFLRPVSLDEQTGAVALIRSYSPMQPCIRRAGVCDSNVEFVIFFVFTCSL